MVPVQAVQTGPETRFVYVVGEDRKVTPATVKLALIEGAFAVVEGVAPGARVVIEGAQNLRPGSVVAEAERAAGARRGGAGKGGKAGKAAEKGA